VIKVTWALAGEHMDEWQGATVEQGAATLEERVGAVLDGSGMQSHAVAGWRRDFLAPVVESLRTEGTGALSQGDSWSKAAGPFLACASLVR
jgi:hypothetical protein